jgi:hypothetical protein
MREIPHDQRVIKHSRSRGKQISISEPAGFHALHSQSLHMPLNALPISDGKAPAIADA